ncbi:MAG: hypothetical protein AAB474_00085 [Patescibacteria group bacterium]
MSPKIIFLLLHIVFLAIYAMLVGALLWHYKKYSLPKDKARWIIGAFLVICATLAIASTVLLFLIPWKILLKNV